MSLHTDADETVTQSFHLRANRSGFPIQVSKKRRYAREKVQRSVVLTPLTSSFVLHVRRRDLASPRSASSLHSSLETRPLGLRYVCPSRPTVRVSSARGAESVAINWPLALTVDAGHDIRNVARIQCFRALDGSGRFHPCRVDESVAWRNQFRAQIPYLRARRNRRFELIVDEPSRALFLPLPSSLFFFSHNSRTRAFEWSKEYLHQTSSMSVGEWNCSGDDRVAKIAKNLISIVLIYHEVDV